MRTHHLDLSCPRSHHHTRTSYVSCSAAVRACTAAGGGRDDVGALMLNQLVIGSGSGDKRFGFAWAVVG